jgi:hypothetical protein
MHPALLQLYAEQPAPAPLVIDGDAYSPARLFKAVYCTNLLRNGEFLERTNSTRSTAGGAGARSVTWVSAALRQARGGRPRAHGAPPLGDESAPRAAALLRARPRPPRPPPQVPTHNSKGLSWEYPLLDPALPPPPACATHLGGDGSPSPSTSRTASAPIDIRRPGGGGAPPLRAAAALGAAGAAAADPGPLSASLVGSPGSLPGSPGSPGGSSYGSAGRGASGAFAVGCIAPTCVAWSELVQVVDLGEALAGSPSPCCAPGLPRALAAAALASGAVVEVSVWVAGAAPPRRAGPGARGPAGPAGPAAASEVQVLAALVPPGDAAAAGVPLASLLKATAPFGDALPPGLPPADAQRLLSDASRRGLASLGLTGTQLAAEGPRPVGPEWSQIKLRLRLPPPPPGACPDDALAAAPRLVVALRGRAGATGVAARAGARGPKFMAARVSLVALDDE